MIAGVSYWRKLHGGELVCIVAASCLVLRVVCHGWSWMLLWPMRRMYLPTGSSYAPQNGTLHILTISTRARVYTLCSTRSPVDRSSSLIVRGCTVIRAKVPAPFRFDNVPGLITSTLSTTCSTSASSQIESMRSENSPSQTLAMR